MKQAEEPKLDELKKLLKRLEKIDPESAPSPPSSAAEPPAGPARKSKQAILDKPANDADPADTLLQLKSRDNRQKSPHTDEMPVELPAVVKPGLPATVRSAQEPGAFHTVIIASVTAAVVSALATAGTVYWLNRGPGRVALERPAISSAPALDSDAFSESPLTARAEPPGETLGETPVMQPETPVSLPGETEPAAAATQPNELPANTGATVSEPGTPQVAATGAPPPPGREPERPETQTRASDQAPDPTATLETAVGSPDEESLSAPADTQEGRPHTARATPAHSEEPPREVVNAGDQPASITPPRPQLAGIPDVSGEIEQSDNGTQMAAVVLEPDVVMTPEPASGIKTADDSAQSVSEISSGRELAAAAQSGVGAQATLHASKDRDTPSAAAATEAPVVAAFEAPEAPPIVENTQPASAETAIEAPSEAAAGAPLPQIGPGEVALHHSELAKVATGQPVPFPLQVLGAREDLKGHHLIITGLKRGSTLSAGTELMFDAWRVDISELPDLKLVVPEGFAHRLHILAELRRPDGTTRKKSELVLSTPGAAAELVPDTQEVKGLDPRILRNVYAGEVQIDNGGLSAARILFQRAADAGSSRAAMLLAATYDPNFTSVFQTIKQPIPNPAEARRWYARASQLGASLAAERLSRLDTR